MQAAKKYLVWIIISGVILGFLGFHFLYVGGIAAGIQQENQEIARQVEGFTRFVRDMGQTVPTPRDLEIGGEFLDDILSESRRASAMLVSYARYLNRKPVTDEPLVFADNLNRKYLQTMVEAEIALGKRMIPSWEKMNAQSMFATDYRATQESAQAFGRATASTVVEEQAHIFTPRELIPFRLSEDFQSPEKRLRYWRNYLIFHDVLNRAVVNSVAEVRREVISFERPPQDFDETTGKLKTDITRVDIERFLENITKLEIEQVETGDGIVPDFSAGEGAEAGEAGLPGAPEAGAPEAGMPGGRRGRGGRGEGVGGEKYFDAFEVRLEIVAHLKVVDAFQREILRSEDLLYVPVRCEVVRLADTVTMGNYEMPTGDDGRKPVADAAYAETPAVGVNPASAFEWESPVRALLVYRIYRPRTAGAENPRPQMAPVPGGGFVPGM